MKSKLLLTLGLVSILGMAQASEASSDIDVIDVARFILKRLSPEQRTALLAEYASQGTAVPVVRKKASVQLPEWIEEKFGKGYRGDDVVDLSFSASYDGSVSAYISREGIPEKYYDFETTEQTRDLVKAVIHGFAANAKYMHLNFDALDDNLTEVFIDRINKGGFSNLETLSLDAGRLEPAKKARLEQALLNIRSSNLKSLTLYGGSFEFAKAMAETKVRNPELSTVIISGKLPENLNIVHGDFNDTVTHNGVDIGSSYEYDKSVEVY